MTTDRAMALALGGRGFGPGGSGAPQLAVVPKPAPRTLQDGEIELGRNAGGDVVGLNLGKLVEGRLLIQANSGAGKSMLLRRIFEEAFGRVQLLLIDADGEFSTLAEILDVAVLGAEEVGRVGAEAFALHLREHRYSAVLDLSDMPAEQRVNAIADVAAGLVAAPRAHWHPLMVLIDEVQGFAPHYDAGDVEPATRKRAIAALADMMGRGRKRGIGGVIATQRIAETSKAVSAKATNVIVGRTVFDLDLERAGRALGFTAGASRPLRTLKDGEFICIGPAIGGPGRVRFKAAPAKSQHKGATPTLTPPPAIAGAAAAALLHQLQGPAPSTPAPLPTAGMVRGDHHRRGWSDAEDAIIRDGYARQLTMGQICTALVAGGYKQRSLSGVSTRGQTLGLTSSRTYALWTPEEDDIVISCYRDGLRIADIVKQLALKHYDRNRQAVQMRAIALGVSGDRVNYWTPEETEIGIAGLEAGKPHRQILADLKAAGFHRGVTAIFKFAQKHNFNRRPSPWTPEENEILRKRYDDKVPLRDISRELGKTTAAIATQANRLGIKQREFWTEAERKILIKACERGELLVDTAVRIGRPYPNVAAEARRLGLSFKLTAKSKPRPAGAPLKARKRR